MSVTLPQHPDELRNPKRASLYDHVGIRRENGRVQYQGQCGTKPHFKGEKTNAWYGPRRNAAEEAAWDYIRYVNNEAIPATQASWEAPNIDMGNVTAHHTPVPEEVTIKRKKYTGPHDLYDIVVLTANGDTVCRKIGITARGHIRYLDICKTFGLSIQPYAKAVTLPSEKDARVAESAKIAEVAGDPAWRRVGKESFAPVKEAA